MKQEFAEYIKAHIKDYLPPEYQDAVISADTVIKSNDRALTGLTILKNGEQAAPTIYLEPFAEQVEAGHSMPSVLRQIAEIQTAYKGRVPMEVSELGNYETVRPMLSVQMCDPELNQEYLKDKPCTLCGELAAYYRIQVAADDKGIASVAVTENMMELWGITKEQLHKDAVQAESSRDPVCFYDMEDLLFGGSEHPDNLLQRTEPLNIGFTPMYVLTNQSKTNGAGVLVQDGVLEKVGGLIGSDFYVLPSSVHEVLIVPDNGNMQLAELEDMVREVNATQVAREDRLSDKVQYYDRETKTLGRKQEKSVLKQLADKKAQVRETAAKEPGEQHTAKQEPSL